MVDNSKNIKTSNNKDTNFTPAPEMEYDDFSRSIMQDDFNDNFNHEDFKRRIEEEWNNFEDYLNTSTEETEDINIMPKTTKNDRQDIDQKLENLQRILAENERTEAETVPQVKAKTKAMPVNDGYTELKYNHEKIKDVSTQYRLNQVEESILEGDFSDEVPVYEKRVEPKISGNFSRSKRGNSYQIIMAKAASILYKIIRKPFTMIDSTIHNRLGKKSKKSGGKKGEKGSWKSFFILIFVALTIRSCFFEPYHIPSGSMKPTLIVGDKVFVSKMSYGYSKYSFPFSIIPIKDRIFSSTPNRGDVVVFRYPANPNINYIKRLIGLPGDTIQMKDGVLHINSRPVPKELVGHFTDSDGTKIDKYIETLPNGLKYYVLDRVSDYPVDNTQEFVVPAGHYFMMGDNRDDSQDSRFMDKVGFVPAKNLIGKASRIFISTGEPIWKFWKWGSSFRVKRMFKQIYEINPNDLAKAGKVVKADSSDEAADHDLELETNGGKLLEFLVGGRLNIDGKNKAPAVNKLQDKKPNIVVTNDVKSLPLPPIHKVTKLEPRVVKFHKRNHNIFRDNDVAAVKNLNYVYIEDGVRKGGGVENIGYNRGKNTQNLNQRFELRD